MTNGGGGGDGGWRDLAKVGISMTSFVGVLGALAVTGLLGRTERDQSKLFLVATGLVLVAALFWVSAAIFKGGGEKPLQFVGLLLLGAGFVVGFIAVINTQHSPNRPTISAEVIGSKLVASVKASGLNSSDRIIVYVEGLRVQGAATGIRVTDLHRLYFASVGADGDGNVDEPIKVTLASGRWDAVAIRAFGGDRSECATGEKLVPVEKAGPGCVIIPLLPVPKRPQLTTRWGKDGAMRTLTVSARATNVGGHLFSLRIEGRRRHGRINLARAAAEPSPSGTGAVSLRVDIPSNVRSVCVEGRLSLRPLPRKLLACSISGGAAVAVAVLRVPSR
jgi:hypothetical protein